MSHVTQLAGGLFDSTHATESLHSHEQTFATRNCDAPTAEQWGY